MPFHIIREDITKMNVDIIVNSAHPTPEVGGGVDAAINLTAGNELIIARKKIGIISAGQAFATPAYKLNAKHVIHTVGPVWNGGTMNEEELLRSCYKNSLELARSLDCYSIAFPLISGGIFGYPIREAIQIASEEIKNFLIQHDMDIYLVIFNTTKIRLSNLSKDSIRQFIRSSEIYTNYNNIDLEIHQEKNKNNIIKKNKAGINNSLDFEYLPNNIIVPQESFTELLFRIIDEKGCKDSEVYKKANLDRRLFSKIRSNIEYQPSKPTAIALAIALKLDMDDTLDLIGRAGFTLSPATEFDIIIAYCISNKIYDIYDINEVLFDYKLPLLGA
jgi:O-acetyl-ADP-ribose deacetylase (regulator of RNase III)